TFNIFAYLELATPFTRSDLAMIRQAMNWLSAARSYRTRGPALLDFRPRRSFARSRRSVGIALDRPCGFGWKAAYLPPSSVSSLSSSKGSLNCAGSQYGPPSCNGLGG